MKSLAAIVCGDCINLFLRLDSLLGFLGGLVSLHTLCVCWGLSCLCTLQKPTRIGSECL